MKDQITKSNFIVIFVDDEDKTVKYFERIFGTEFRIIGTTEPESVLDIIADHPREIAVVISDQRMPKINGVDLLSAVKEKNSNIIRILTTAYADLDDNIAAINKSNVFSYLTKPWDIQQVFQTLRHALHEYSNRLNYLSLSGSIAHEMRNPLNSVRQSTEFAREKLNLAHLKERFCANDSEKITPLNKKEFVEIIESLDIAFSSAKRGNVLIDIILDSIKQKSVDTKSFRKFSISQIINSVMQEYSFNSEERSRVVLDITEEQDFEVKCNDTLLSYIFFNLLKNSFYYAKSHPNLTIGIRSEKGEDEFNRIYFIDNGPGIPQSHMSNLFEAFSSSGKEDGTGLGLAFCKKTMSSFGGAISCISKEGEFCEFILAFPKVSTRDSGQERNLILMVKDETGKILEKQEFLSTNLDSSRLDIAQNSKEAVSLIRQNEYRVAIVEIDSLESDKINFAKKIREFDRTISLIAYFDDDKFMASELENMGFDSIIRKKSPDYKLLKETAKWGLINLKNSILEMSEIREILRNKKILLADDENVNLILTSKYLEQFSVETDEVRDGEDALKIAKTKDYDLILMDIKMPELDGISAVKRIRENEAKNKLSPVQIVAFTGNSEREKIREILDYGFNDYFIKGRDYRDLVESMALLLRKK